MVNNSRTINKILNVFRLILLNEQTEDLHVQNANLNESYYARILKKDDFII